MGDTRDAFPEGKELTVGEIVEHLNTSIEILGAVPAGDIRIEQRHFALVEFRRWIKERMGEKL